VIFYCDVVVFVDDARGKRKKIFGWSLRVVGVSRKFLLKKLEANFC
jgi:hypothetical protein